VVELGVAVHHGLIRVYMSPDALPLRLEALPLRLEALVFDAYGTLFDVHSVMRRCEAFFPGRHVALSQLWRSKQLEYTWLRSLMRRYAPFSTVTREALAHACEALRLELTVFKPAPQVYELAPKKLGVAKEKIGFVSSNCWDALGAKSFGFAVFWINRARAPLERLGFTPDRVVERLDEILL